MPMAVASAYDENKNLVPLYVAVDGDDFPYQPVSPGFVITGMDADVSPAGQAGDPKLGQFAITLSAVKPAGGKLDVEGVGSDYQFTFSSLTVISAKIFNYTSYKIRVIASFSGNNAFLSINEVIQPNSFATTDEDAVTSLHLVCDECTVQIEES